MKSEQITKRTMTQMRCILEALYDLRFSRPHQRTYTKMSILSSETRLDEKTMGRLCAELENADLIEYEGSTKVKREPGVGLTTFGAVVMSIDRSHDIRLKALKALIDGFLSKRLTETKKRR